MTAAPVRVLIVEDNPADAELLTISLKNDGCDAQTTTVSTLAGLSRALDTEHWDVILSDFNLGSFTALDALEMLQKTGKDIPFLIVTGSVGEETAAKSMRLGARDFFLKDRVARLNSAIEREMREAAVRRDRLEGIRRIEESERQLKQAVRARDEFLSIASHELKTPLTPLGLQLALARKLIKTSQESGAAIPVEKLDARLVKSAQSVERLTGLINNLLDVTRITSDRLTVARRETDLRDAVARAVDGLQEALKASGSTLVTNAETPVVGLWDPLCIETVVSNLLSNAIKYGEGKPIAMTVACEGSTARLTVSDKGMGIAPAEQGRIFERFERAVSAHHYGGFGIGLWLARRLVEAHGGTIRVASEAGSGSTFTVDLPLSGTALAS